MQRKGRETARRAKNRIETDEAGKKRPRRGPSEVKAAPQRRALPKAKAEKGKGAKKRRQHAGGEPSRRSRKEIEGGRVDLSGRSLESNRQRNNVGSKDQGTAKGRRRKLTEVKPQQNFMARR